MINIGYFGSPDFSADFLEKLIKSNLVNIKTVFTQPDRPAGRKQVLTSTPVKKIALKYNLKVLEIVNWQLIKNLQLEIFKLDIALVYAYAFIISQQLLDIPKYGFWCIHPSLLPKYRGSSPMATALINGDKETGVTIFKMDEKIDHGPIIAQEKYQILSTDKRPDLEKKLTDLAFKMFLNLIKDETKLKYLDKTNHLSKNLPKLLHNQNHKLATYTRLLKKSDGFLPLTTVKKALKNQPLTFEELPEIIKNNYLKNSSIIIWNLFRGLYPWPGIWTILPNGKRLKITEMKMENNKLKIKKVQLEGKKEVDFKKFNEAYKIF